MNYDKIQQDITTIEEIGSLMTITSNTELFEVKDTITEDGESIPVLNDFLNSDYGSYAEQVIKKMMAAAAIASGYEASSEEIASQADASATSIKTAYKVAAGQIDITESLDIMIDRATARLKTFIQDHLDIEFVADKAVDLVATAYPSAALLKPYVRVVMHKIEPLVRKVISKGIDKVAYSLKQGVRTMAKAGFKMIKSIWV